MQIEFLSKFSKDVDRIHQKAVKTNLTKLIHLFESESDLNSIPNFSAV